MADVADVEKAERLGRQRASIFAVQAVIFLSWQTLFVSGHVSERLRNVDEFKISAWLVVAMLLLLLLGTGGMLIRGRKVRGLLNDELTRSHRSHACVLGFWAAMGTAIALYVVDMFEPLSARDVIHIIMSFAIGTGLMTFSILERRSLRES
jgi:cytochrome bd-type quinol oxidase subunit 2